MYKKFPQDLTNIKFGRLQAIKKSVKQSGYRALWDCKCDCGRDFVANRSALTSGNTKSCGCLKIDQLTQRNTKHGKARSSEYNLWTRIKRVCTRPQSNRYVYYGARDIKMCERWHQSFQDFLSDIGQRPTPRHSLDRINNNGDYEPKNVRWATCQEQMLNTRSNRHIIYKEQKLTISQASATFGINYFTLYTRLQHGWPVEKAISTPVRKLKFHI